MQWLTMDQAIEHCTRGAGAGTGPARTTVWTTLTSSWPARGTSLTMETVAAADILREHLPHFRTRVVNVVDLMTLPRRKDHPHGMDRDIFKELFTDHVDVVFAFHGYPGAIHQVVHGRPDADRFRVRGFIEEGTTTTPFDMVVLNRDVAIPPRVWIALEQRATEHRQGQRPEGLVRQSSDDHALYVVENLEDMPEVRDWNLTHRATED